VSKCFLTLLALYAALAASARSTPQDLPNPGPAYRHAYYLFLADPPNACEACYVPLLLTSAPLDAAAKNPGGQNCDLITTYERNSIFQFNGIVHVAPRDIAAPPRTIRVRSRNYRYQEITATEVLRLLENPQGTIPVSRPFLHSDLPPGPSLEQLIADFRAVK
jgi:hypothetical protein